ncbi:N-alpha-acetyltransferase 40 [Fopius arisanus]|uniref:N-alpha-acetyltransferase 40 n=1 Tax=Fopius arisanus TaxID=64838 RepID=A0A9R1U5M5_9HYME|nr:PREDICTED: N-alpha-acetyltransferase 40 [Fopius arisanus]
MKNKKGHKTRKQLLAEKETAAKRLVEKANAQENPLDAVENFHSYCTPDGTDVKLRCERVGNLPEGVLPWVFDLMERNVKAMYEKSNWGWNESSKRKELTEPSAWYLTASVDDQLVAFSHFRYDLDDKVEVVYCYELQLESRIRRKGLGRFMMKCLEGLAAASGMKKVVLTVFKHNTEARSFYEALGYKLDRTSPADWENLDYIIISK